MKTNEHHWFEVRELRSTHHEPFTTGSSAAEAIYEANDRWPETFPELPLPDWSVTECESWEEDGWWYSRSRAI